MDATVCSQCGTPRPKPRFRKPANLRQLLWGGWTCPHCGCEFDAFNGLLTPQPPSRASNPGNLTITPALLRRFLPELYGIAGLRHRWQVKAGLDWDKLGYLKDHPRFGDTRAAVVVMLDPLRVSAYTDELDAVAMLEFPEELIESHGLRLGTRLLSVNIYFNLHEPNSDIVPCPRATGRWNCFNPVIADFVSDDYELILKHKTRITSDEWYRTLLLGKDYLKRWPDLARDGRPTFSGLPAKPPEDRY